LKDPDAHSLLASVKTPFRNPLSANGVLEGPATFPNRRGANFFRSQTDFCLPLCHNPISYE